MNIDLYCEQLNDIIKSEEKYALDRKFNGEEVIPPIKKELLESFVNEMLIRKHYDLEKFNSLKEKAEFMGYNLIVTQKDSHEIEEKISELCQSFKEELFGKFLLYTTNSSLYKRLNNLYLVLVNLFGRTNFRDIFESFCCIMEFDIKP